jgi:hypothetical protein
MTRRGYAAAVTIGVGALATAAAGVAADRPARIVYHDAFTVTHPGRATARLYSTRLSAPGDPHGKPPPVAHIHTELPLGARYDGGAVPACTATDAQVMVQGAAACPARSRVGRNDFVIDTGLPGAQRYLHEDLTYLNEPGGIKLLARDRTNGQKLVFHATVDGRSADVDMPPVLPGAPPDGGSPRSETAIVFKATGAGGRGFVTTPATCPRSRTWRFRFVYTFRDGRTQTVTSDQRCTRRRAQP